MAGCGGVGEAVAASVVVEGIDGDWPTAEIEERLWIGCGIETDPEVGDDKVECGGGDWTALENRVWSDLGGVGLYIG